MALNTKEGCGEGDGQNFDLEHRNTPANEASDEEDTVEKIRFDPVTGTMTLTSTAFAGDDSHWVGRTEKEVAAEDGGVFSEYIISLQVQLVFIVFRHQKFFVYVFLL